jgi:DNA-binding NtrC family response regulator
VQQSALAGENRELRRVVDTRFPMVGTSPALEEVRALIARVGPTHARVLITGDNGTGKELVARALHEASPRRERAFIEVNCAAIPTELIESELFGHMKGSFTGAFADRAGKFELADGGTLFLDEVSEIPLPLQVKLLRFLQEKEFERVGGNETLRVDVRIVAATNRELVELIDDGAFREDLYYRLNVIRLDVPPLRARKSDVPLLAEHFLRRYVRENESDIEGFTDEARRALLSYPWPGNVRELENAIERAVVLATEPRIGAELMPHASPHPRPGDALELMIPGLSMAEIERLAIEKTLDAVDGSTSRAAEILGISRRKIQYRLKEWSEGRDGSGDDDEE